MSEQKLAAEVRTEFGKGFARRARMAGLIPAVIYGHGAEPIHITLPAKATTLAVRIANALLSLDVNGEEHLALVKDIQRDPIKQIIEHIDLLTVRKGEKVTVDVPVHLDRRTGSGQRLQPGTDRHLPRGRGNPPADRHRGQHRRPFRRPAHHASDLVLPKGSVLLADAEPSSSTSPRPLEERSREPPQPSNSGGSSGGRVPLGARPPRLRVPARAGRRLRARRQTLTSARTDHD